MSVYFCFDSASVFANKYHNKERAFCVVWGDCKLSIAYIAEDHKYQLSGVLIFSHIWSPSTGEGTTCSQEVFHCIGAAIWILWEIGWVLLAAGLHGCHMFVMFVCEWEVEWAGWGHLSEELFTCFPCAAKRAVIWASHTTLGVLHTIVPFGN